MTTSSILFTSTHTYPNILLVCLLGLDVDYGDDDNVNGNDVCSSNRLTTLCPDGQASGLGFTMPQQHQQQQQQQYHRQQSPSQPPQKPMDTIHRPSGPVEHVFTGLGMYSPGTLKPYFILSLSSVMISYCVLTNTNLDVIYYSCF